MRKLVIAGLFAVLPFALPAAWAADCWSTPPGSPERKAVLDTLRVKVQGELNQDVVFRVERLALCDDWAFVEAEPQQPNGKPIDWSITLYRDAVEDGVCGGFVDALLRKSGERWQVRASVTCASDVPWVTWAEEFGAPVELFPKIE